MRKIRLNKKRFFKWCTRNKHTLTCPDTTRSRSCPIARYVTEENDTEGVRVSAKFVSVPKTAPEELPAWAIQVVRVVDGMYEKAPRTVGDLVKTLRKRGIRP